MCAAKFSECVRKKYWGWLLLVITVLDGRGWNSNGEKSSKKTSVNVSLEALNSPIALVFFHISRLLESSLLVRPADDVVSATAWIMCECSLQSRQLINMIDRCLARSLISRRGEKRMALCASRVQMQVWRCTEARQVETWHWIEQWHLDVASSWHGVSYCGREGAPAIPESGCSTVVLSLYVNTNTISGFTEKQIHRGLTFVFCLFVGCKAK